MKFSKSMSYVISILALIFFSSPLHAGQEEVWWEDALQKGRDQGYQLISTSDLRRLYDEDKDMKVIDNRYEYEFKNSTILPGAINIPFRPAERDRLSPEKEEMLLSAMGEDKERRIIFYCRSFR